MSTIKREWGGKPGTVVFTFAGGRMVLVYGPDRPIGIVEQLSGSRVEKQILLEQAFQWVSGEGLDGLYMIFLSGADIAQAKDMLGIKIEPEAAICRLVRRKLDGGTTNVHSTSQHAVKETAGQGVDESVERQDDSADGGGGSVAESGSERTVDTVSKRGRREATAKRGRSVAREVDIGEGID